MNGYEVLKIPVTATRDDIRAAYRALARRWHPDRFMAGPERDWANDKMAEINAAYHECLDGLKRVLKPAETENAALAQVQSLIDSGNYLSALIRKETGITFHEHVLNAKMAVACNLLADPRMLVEEVARAVGYGNYISFYNAFKRSEHMTPTEYRNRRVTL